MNTKTKLLLIGMTLITSQNSLAASLTPVALAIPSSTITTLVIPPSPPPVIAPISVTPPKVTYALQATPISIGYVVLKANKGEVSLCKPPVSIDPNLIETPSCWFIDTVYPSLSGATLSSQPRSNTVLITNNDNGTVSACGFAILPGATQASGACTGIADMSITAPAVTQLW